VAVAGWNNRPSRLSFLAATQKIANAAVSHDLEAASLQFSTNAGHEEFHGIGSSAVFVAKELEDQLLLFHSLPGAARQQLKDVKLPTPEIEWLSGDHDRSRTEIDRDISQFQHGL